MDGMLSGLSLKSVGATERQRGLLARFGRLGEEHERKGDRIGPSKSTGVVRGGRVEIDCVGFPTCGPDSANETGVHPSKSGTVCSRVDRIPPSFPRLSLLGSHAHSNPQCPFYQRRPSQVRDRGRWNFFQPSGLYKNGRSSTQFQTARNPRMGPIRPQSTRPSSAYLDRRRYN